MVGNMKMINLKKHVLFICGLSVLSNNLMTVENNNQDKEDLTLKQKISQKYKNIKDWVSENKYKVILSCVGLLSAINFANSKHQSSNSIKQLRARIFVLEGDLADCRRTILEQDKNIKDQKQSVIDEDKLCPICSEKESDIALSCDINVKHRFCKECLRGHIRINSSTCPICRRVISLNDLNSIQGNSRNNTSSLGRW